MANSGSEIVDLLKKRQGELQAELERVDTALKALGAPQRASAPQPAAPKKKAGRPAASVGGKTVLDLIEAAITSAGRALRVKELEKLTGAAYSTLAATLRRGREQKRLRNPSFGLWTIPGIEAKPAIAKKAKVKAKKTPAEKTAKKTRPKAAKKRGPQSKAKKAAVIAPPAPSIFAPPMPPAG